jgi:hypothetical protein
MFISRNGRPLSRILEQNATLAGEKLLHQRPLFVYQARPLKLSGFQFFVRAVEYARYLSLLLERRH